MPRKNLYLASLPLLVLVPSFLGAKAAFGLSPKQQQKSPSVLTLASTSSSSVLLAQWEEPSNSDDREHCRQEGEIYQDLERDRQNLHNDEDESDRRHDQQELNRDHRRLEDLKSADSRSNYNCDYLYGGDYRDYNRSRDDNRDREDNREYDHSRDYNRDDNYNRKSPEINDPWSDSREQDDNYNRKSPEIVDPWSDSGH